MDYRAIYTAEAEKYDLLVAREDYQGNILPALEQVCPFAGLDVVELGAGTGRLTCLLAPWVRTIHAFDVSLHMLSVAQARLAVRDKRNWSLGVADNRQLPVAARTADVAIAGWSLGHSVGWYPQTWRDEIEQALVQMKRVLRPGGTIMLLETQGTGRETPQPPSPGLTDFYRWLEGNYGFRATWVRTDYRFASVDEAADLTRFFFGDELADNIVRNRTVVLPECTGIWWLTV